MSSWFDQLDIGVDLNALQEHLVKSVEEATELVDSLGRMEIMNLDEMAEKQEAEGDMEEEEEEIIEEIVVHHDDEDEIPGEVVYHDDNHIDDNNNADGYVPPPHLTSTYHKTSNKFKYIEDDEDAQYNHHHDLSHLVAVTADDSLLVEEGHTPSSVTAAGYDVFDSHIHSSSIPNNNSNALNVTPKRVGPGNNPIQRSTSTKKVVTRKTKRPKKKKKQKGLDFFGTGAYDDPEEDQPNDYSRDSHSSAIQQTQPPLMKSHANFDNDAGFALGSLFDIDMPSTEDPFYHHSNVVATNSSNIANDVEAAKSSFSSDNHNNNSGNNTAGNDDISSYITTFFTSTASNNANNNPADLSVVGSVLSMTLPSTTFSSFFDTIDDDINLAEDPILQQVEKNRSLGYQHHHNANVPSYIAYLESVLPPPARFFGTNTAADTEDIEQNRRKQQQQQQVDRILGLTRSGANHSQNSNSHLTGVQAYLGYTRNCLVQSRNILCYDLLVTIIFREHLQKTLFQTLVEVHAPFFYAQGQRIVHNSASMCFTVSNSAHSTNNSTMSSINNTSNNSNTTPSKIQHLYQVASGFSAIAWNLCKCLWLLVYVVLRIVISVLWHLVQVSFLGGLYISQCWRASSGNHASNGNGSSASNNLSAEERLQQWRTRWRSFAEEYLSSNNALMIVTAVLFVYSYYHFQRYSTDAGD